MLLKSLRRIVGASALALVATAGLSLNAFAQKGGDGVLNDEVSWPTSFTLGFGGAANMNFNGSGAFNPDETLYPGYSWTQSHGYAAPEIHILAEIPIAKNLMFAPRIAYNDYSVEFDNAATIGTTTTSIGGGDHGLAVSMPVIGADILFKWALSNFHLMAGANLSTPLAKQQYYVGQPGPNMTKPGNGQADAIGTDLPNAASFLAGLKGGLGYDIPLNMKHTIWLTPEAFYTYSVTDYQQAHNSFELFPVTLTGGASLKFALNGPEAPPPPLAVNATITARGVMPDGSIVPEPVSPQSATHTRASLPLLPYVFFDNNSAAITARYNRSGATGFNIQSALADKTAIDANHDLLDVVGQRLKDNPTWNVSITGCNSNTKDEKGNVTLSRARATAVADYLRSTWGVADSRITIDARNLPALPTNPVTGAGIEENRRVEIASNSADLTAPIRIETRENASVGPTQVRFDMGVTPSPATHDYANWRVTLDKDGVQLADAATGTGAPPASTTMTVSNAAAYLNQPVHYTLTVTDAAGQTATADGFTRIVPRTVDRENLERYAMLSFDFDRADINQRARQMLQLISESVSRDATGVKIDGFCDSTGTDEYNQQLSEARAAAAATALRSMTTLPANVQVHGHGERDPKFSNDLPEGRQLNRRVEFTVEKSSQ